MTKPFKAPVTRAYLQKAALFYLERYAASSETLRQVLRRKVERRCRMAVTDEAVDGTNSDPQTYDILIDEVVAACRSSQLVDDEAYAKGKVASLRRRGASERAIRAKLAVRGISGEIAAVVLEEQDEGSEIRAAFIFARRRKLGPYRLDRREEYRLQDMAKLGRAGFSGTIIRQVMDGKPEGSE